jgi:hypothetical protein
MIIEKNPTEARVRGEHNWLMEQGFNLNLILITSFT